mmetsp:Transcript_28942/g.81508  ORF Transcript_28942/g.81508 Transcript_28942/m.81508 type:complete len:268 (+) Transcript_28942:236-1039(+)|eukprot:CAMPEP_0117672006 /NCGR_PEP_ID=MMETSP0804-20121206/13663_1 /TAXON_ID=1074897 /ORGANISM="Tetraselmis astigmatica, Strain CCMP880" /LENGTH=267 /DNA_ID=CAMNT_0005480557 /DNA_START=173 /DNA_END=976 /DNA_ORIENTATION=-
MERAFDRAFERKLHTDCMAPENEGDRAHTNCAKQGGAATPDERSAGHSRDSEEDGMDHSRPISADDAIPRILLYHKQRDYFRCLQLPQPTCDEINRPVWSCASSDISRSYRNISKFVHPDKNPHPQAREAFEALNQVVKALRDPSELEVLMKHAAEVAREKRDRQAGGGSVQDRILHRAGHREREKALKKEQQNDFDSQIRAQMLERQERFKRKKQLQSQGSRYRRQMAEDESPDEEPEKGHVAAASGDEESRPVKLVKRKKPKMLF